MASSRQDNARADTADVLIVGGGIVGLSTALEIRRRLDAPRVVLIDKEPALGLHASGRNSGVLHAGFYYGADSLKARYCRDGNRAMTEYCLDRSLPILQCGKLVVARTAAEVAGVDELLRRGRVNGVDVQEVSEAEAGEIDPAVRTVEKALWSPTTSSVDPRRVVESLTEDAQSLGVDIRTSTAFVARTDDGVRTSRGSLSAGYVVNAAGLHADTVAREWGFSRDLTILPFKGLYLKSDAALPLRTHVYPVPNLEHPFLGVHFTMTATGAVKIGPTAIPALWRESYGGLGNFRLDEMLEIGKQGGRLFLSDAFNFRGLAFQEIRKQFKSRLIDLAEGFLHEPIPRRGWAWAPPGIRAQLLDTRTRTLVMDFKLEGDDQSMHVLNAVSPAFTCSLPFARHVVDEIERTLGHGAPSPPSGTPHPDSAR